MAKIPRGEGFGEVVARPARFNESQMPRSAFGEPIAGAMVQVGGQLMQQERQDAAEMKRLREAADRAQAVQRMQLGELELDELSRDIADRVATGALDKTTAQDEWQAVADRRMSDTLDGVPASQREIVKGSLELRARRASSNVREGIARRDRDDTRAGLLSYLESQERHAVTAPEVATEAAIKAISTLGPAAGYGPAEIEKMFWGFRERVAGNRGQALVRSASNDPKALEAAMEQLQGEEFADLTPERRGALENQVLARRSYLEQREQTRIARAEAAAARRAREAESAFNAAQSVIDSGGMPSPEYLDQVSAKTAGTPYGAALRELLTQGAERATFAQLPPQQQQARILDMRAQANAQGTTPQLEKRIATMQSIAEQSQRQLDQDPLMWGVNRRLLDEVQPIDVSNLQTLPMQLASRAEQAATVAARAGRPVSPLLKAEAEQFAQVLGTLPVPQQRTTVQALARSLDPRSAQALAAQVSPKNEALGLALFLAPMAGRAPQDPAELILRGADALKAGRIKPAGDDVSARDAYRAIAADLSKVDWPTTQARDAAITAAQKVYDGLRDAGGATPRKAVELATGGLADWNGAKVPVPYGMTEREFGRALRTLDPKRVEEMAGGPNVRVGSDWLGVGKLVQNIDALRLIPAGPGSYALESGGRLVTKANGAPMRIKVGD